MKEGKIKIGIDASRNRSGGAIAHLVGILSEFRPEKYNIFEIHVWVYRSLADKLPDRTYIIKHFPDELDKTLVHQVIWQKFSLQKELRETGCDILFTTDASTFCRFQPQVVLSQDMLSYEPGMMKSYGLTKAWLRLLLILYVQNSAFGFANGVIFLTKYAASVIQKSCGQLKSISIIPHGVHENYKKTVSFKKWPENGEQPVNCIYVSNAELYKHQWNVIRAIAHLRNKGYEVKLQLVGGGHGVAQKMILKTIAEVDPEENFISQIDFVSQEKIIDLLENSDISVFASSCENMPVTLVESMSCGLPIACSDRGPMPEILLDGGLYFDPENVESIAKAIEIIILDPGLRSFISMRARQLSQQYSWSRCSSETFEFIQNTYFSCIG